MSQPWPTLFNPKLTNYLENSNQSGTVTEQMLHTQVGTQGNKNWAQLYCKSVGQDQVFDKTKWNWPVNVKSVTAELKKGPLIVLMAQDPFNDHEADTVEQLSKITDDFVVLSGNAKYFLNPKKHICYLPYWYLMQKSSLVTMPATGSPRPYSISSLNGKSKYHRIENFIKLRTKPYFKQILFGMHNNFDIEQCKLETQLEFWNDNIIDQFKSLLSCEELQQGHTSDYVNTHPAYTDAYVNYVTETSIRTSEIFCSEKTWKPFISGQFGIWLSNPGHVQFLRAIGLDVFDDVFAGHAYDRELNLNKRIDMIHDLIDRIMSTDLTSVYQDTLARRQANIDLFYNNDFENLLTAQCKDYQL
jgi:hypothetical protein